MSTKSVFRHKYRVPLLAILACVLWGSAFPSLKVSYKELLIAPEEIFNKMLFAAYRFFLASMMLIALYLLGSKGRWKTLKLSKNEYHYLFWLGMVQTALQYFFFYNGLANTTGVKASILTTLGIFLTVVISHFVYNNDKLNLQKVLGLIAGFLGVIIVNIEQGSFTFTFAVKGEGFIIMSAITSTIAVFMVKRLTGKITPLLITAYQMFFGSLVLFLISIVRVSPFGLPFNPDSFALLIYLAFVSAAGFGIWYNLIQQNTLGYISIYRFIIPVSGVFLSTLFLPEESLSINIFLALFLVSTGIVFINLRRKKTKSIFPEEGK